MNLAELVTLRSMTPSVCKNFTWEFGAIVFGVAAVSCTPLTVKVYSWPAAMGVALNTTVKLFPKIVALLTVTPLLIV